MTRPRPAKAVLTFKPPAHQLVETIRGLASDSSNVMPSEHAFERMDQRGITLLDVLRVLQRGGIEGEIVSGANLGEWKCKVVERRRKARPIGVVTIVIKEKVLLVKTVEWEDR